MSRMRLLIVSGRTLNKAATVTWGRPRRWCRMVARSRSARVRTGRRSDQPGTVTAAFVQVGFPLLVVECHHGGDQGVPSLGRQPGQGRVA